MRRLESKATLYDDFGGVISARDKSRRKGMPKSDLCVGGEPIMERVAAVCRSSFVHNLIVARDPRLYRSVRPPVYPDTGSIVELHTGIESSDRDAPEELDDVREVPVAYDP